MFEGLGKILIITGVVIAVVGLLLVFSGRVPFLGKLPGDILIKRDGFTLYLPVVTSLALSVILTLIINFVLRFLNK